MQICGKAHSDQILLLLDYRREYDTIVELRDTALYYGKLMSYYGFDVKRQAGPEAVSCHQK